MEYSEFIKEFDNCDNLNEEQLAYVFKNWNNDRSHLDFDYGSYYYKDILKFDIKKHTRIGYNLSKLENQHRTFDKYLHCLPIDMTQPVNKIAESVLLQYIYKQYTENIPDIQVIPKELLSNIIKYDDILVNVEGSIIDYTSMKLYLINVVDFGVSIYNYRTQELDFKNDRLTNVLCSLKDSLLLKTIDLKNSYDVISVYIVTKKEDVKEDNYDIILELT